MAQFQEHLRLLVHNVTLELTAALQPVRFVLRVELDSTTLDLETQDVPNA